ncbi:SRPBCC family protein [Aporhodopirellula aestuarii]|uniref:SRPBCC family protein n=1 Tax=Aporhodopirellula aestuarii TaxID=2950107 RepID=A0ABT0U703_9BACT|nr:SRPBCC family protein [Aporhodopirellula aestuarii]MCM2372727.1 SRPBCC family protein [Aporhodopirellula aestuarii]
MSNAVELHRVLRARDERVYRAFLDAAALARWLPPYGFVGAVYEMDARVGGGHGMSFTNFSTGSSHSFKRRFVELTPYARLVYTDRFDDPGLAGEINVIVTLRPVVCGTELQIKQSGIPDVIPAEMCYLGWQESLTMLTHLVEPNIPDGT